MTEELTHGMRTCIDQRSQPPTRPFARAQPHPSPLSAELQLVLIYRLLCQCTQCHPTSLYKPSYHTVTQSSPDSTNRTTVPGTHTAQRSAGAATARASNATRRTSDVFSRHDARKQYPESGGRKIAIFHATVTGFAISTKVCRPI